MSINISDELLASYIDGNLNSDEDAEIFDMIKESSDSFEEYHLSSMAAGVADGGEMSVFSQAGDGMNVETVFPFPFGHDAAALNCEPVLCGEFGDGLDSFFANAGSIMETNNLNNNLMERNVIGEESLVQQQYNDTCAIKSQQIILQEFGIDVSEDQLVEFSAENGWYSGHGTLIPDIGKLIAAADIPCTQKIDANIFDLTNELAQGHKVIIGVDSGELWEPGMKEWYQDVFEGNVPDHALIVAGIDNTDPNNPMVLLTDPGTGDTCKPYPLDQFMDAWNDSDNFMVSTDVAPADFGSTQIANNQPAMYIPEIAGHTYQDFQLFHDLSLSFPSYDSWNFDMFPQYPVASLTDAYLMGDSLLNHSGDFFARYVDQSTFLTAYSDTLNFGMENFLSDGISDGFHDYMIDHSGMDYDALNDYLNGQIEHYTSCGEMEAANFFSQQADFVNYCHESGCDPIGFYDQYFDGGAMIF